MKLNLDNRVQFHNYHPTPSDILHEVYLGLEQEDKAIPPKFFYDQKGSDLFTEITQLDEYYPTRTELGILVEQGEKIGKSLGEDLIVVEYGCGSSEKIFRLLEVLRRPKTYMAIDISQEHLIQMTQNLAQTYPQLEVIALCADFTAPLTLPLNGAHQNNRRLGFFPGSSIGNFEPAAAQEFLKNLWEELGHGGGLLIGVDLIKDPEILNEAYNDSKGVTAKFNKNLLARINRECGSDFNPDNFSHRAFYNSQAGRIEMHLVSQVDQKVHLNGSQFSLQTGESIHTENSYKYSLEQFKQLARGAGWNPVQAWTDEANLFSMHYFNRP